MARRQHHYPRARHGSSPLAKSLRTLRPVGLVLLVIASLYSTVALLSWKNEAFALVNVNLDATVAQGASDVGGTPDEVGVKIQDAYDEFPDPEAGASNAESGEAARPQQGSGGGERRSSSSSGRRRGRSQRSSSSSSSSTPSQERRRRREKEHINKDAVDFDKISKQIIAQLTIPGTDPYKHKFPDGTRLVVNKEQPENRLARTAAEKSASNLPATDIKERWGSCAVVGNSGLSLFNDKQGEAVDKHDVVIRFNDGPTANFEKYVGTKTTFRFVNNNWSRIYTRRQPRGCDEEALMLFGNGAVRFLHGLNAKYRAVGKHIYFMAPEFALNARGTYKKSAVVMDEIGYIRVKGRNSPPTGIEGLFFALEVCDTVDLYGFQIANDPKTKYHYHNEVKGVEAAHSFGFQYEFLKVLMQGGFIQVCLPETEDGSCVHGGKA